MATTTRASTTVITGSKAPRSTLYCRVSTSSQRENYSLPEQERLCREWCAEQGYTVTALYSDVDEGDDYYGRRGFSAMRQAMARREFDAIVFLEQDRLVARGGPKHIYALQTECEEYEVKLFCVLEPLHDAEDEDAGLVDYIEARHTRSEKQKIAVRTQRGRRARAQAGKLIPGCVPLYGFQWADGAGPKDTKTHYVIDPETWPIVQRIRREGAEGVPQRRIAAQLTKEGVPTPSQVLARRGLLPRNKVAGNVWSPVTVLKILKHPTYAGEPAAYRHEFVVCMKRDPYTGERRRVRTMRFRSPDDPAIVPLSGVSSVGWPVVDGPEVTAAIAARLARNVAEASRHTKDPEVALLRGGYAVCGYCGANLSTRKVAKGSHGPDYPGIRIYYCPRQYQHQGVPCVGATMSVHKLESLVWGRVCQCVTDEWFFQRTLPAGASKAIRPSRSTLPTSRLARALWRN